MKSMMLFFLLSSYSASLYAGLPAWTQGTWESAMKIDAEFPFSPYIKDVLTFKGEELRKSYFVGLHQMHDDLEVRVLEENPSKKFLRLELIGKYTSEMTLQQTAKGLKFCNLNAECGLYLSSKPQVEHTGRHVIPSDLEIDVRVEKNGVLENFIVKEADLGLIFPDRYDDIFPRVAELYLPPEEQAPYLMNLSVSTYLVGEGPSEINHYASVLRIWMYPRDQNDPEEKVAEAPFAEVLELGKTLQQEFDHKGDHYKVSMTFVKAGTL